MIKKFRRLPFPRHGPGERTGSPPPFDQRYKRSSLPPLTLLPLPPMPSSRPLVYFVIIYLTLLAAAHSNPQRRNVEISTTNRRDRQSDSTEYDGPLNFDGTWLSVTNTSDWSSNKIVKRDPDFKTLVLSPHEGFSDTWTGSISISGKASEQVVFSTSESNTWIREYAFDVDGLSPTSSFKEADYEGEVYQVTVTVAGIEVEMDIARVSKCPEEYETARVGSGVVGLGFGPGTFFHKPGFLQHAIKQKRVKEPVFAFDFGKGQQPEIHFGGLDKTRFSGEIEWHELVPFKRATSWIISKGQINIDSEEGVVQGMVTLIDTGAQGIYGPANAVEKIYKHIPGSVQYKPRRYAVPCDNLPKINLRWGVGKPREFKQDSFIVRKLEEGHEIYKIDKVKKETPMCLTALRVNTRCNEEYDWIFGITSLRNVYVAFDMGEHRIGFGEFK
ncbi:hypothetical protein APHAL10511_005417 [Amanita phalloides]|nr:hypothetical protein APHAL10511_005417 [Amanita phalloides]